jgi:hypothetical protein
MRPRQRVAVLTLVSFLACDGILGLDERTLRLPAGDGGGVEDASIGLVADANADQASLEDALGVDGDATPLPSPDGGRDSCTNLVDGFAPPWIPPLITSACSLTQIQGFYDGCIGLDASQAACAPYGPDGSASDQACAACLHTAPTASALGPLLGASSGAAVPNVAGCVALEEKLLDGGGCPGQLEAYELCVFGACGCVASDFGTCIQNAGNAPQLCKTYLDNANVACADAGDLDGGGCLALNISGRDWFLAAAPLFCAN